ncbi:MAG TPA: CPBP family intramembrane glutamic endopeptidase [Candidatus Saccharimonadales bacterium]|nr:CPBP family intramembrane glutamic endopeptidase [Candidatus Saccharimonadales bacterium]
MTSWKGVGLVRPAGQLKNLSEGFAWGFASMAVVACIAFSAGARTWNESVTLVNCLEAFSAALLSSVVVGLLEELLFRGALQGSLGKVHPWTLAVLLSSGFYALVHFFHRPESPSEITWLSGFVILARMLAGFVDPELLIPGFLTLLLAGTILGLAYLRTGTLYQSIGLHAGWIFWLRFYGAIAVETDGARSHRSLWGTGKLFDGWLAFMILLPVLMVFWRNQSRYNEPSLHTGSEELA